MENTNTKLNLSLDYRLITIILLVVIAGMLVLWRPWEDSRAKDRTVEVTGQTTIKAVPDEFVFTPTYQFKNANKDAALSELAQKSEQVVAKLKELGVADNKIKTNSDGYDYPAYREGNNIPTYTLRLTVTIENKELAQKVQDYLLTTSPTGAVSPQANFSDKKRKELEDKARDDASKDARAKAEQSAKNLGFSLGAVKSVNDGAGFGIYAGRGADTAEETAQKLTIQPGENELTYTVTVTYFVK
ncbi:MAG: SIMPL domain-containing protein [Candidatus Saccharimonadales bacterium]